MRNEGLVKTYFAGAAIAAHRIVAPNGTDDLTVIQAAAATSKSIGVSDLGADASGDRVDVIISDIALVEYGGNVAEGDPLTADADGKAVVAAPAVGANVRVIGFATVNGVSGDIGSVRIAPSVMQG